MNNMRLIRTLKNAGYLSKNTGYLRCKYWSTCGRKECIHYEPHTAYTHDCIYNSPVKYCARARGFVHDVPYVKGMYADDECDPNLAFKAKRDAQKRYASAGISYMESADENR